MMCSFGEPVLSKEMLTMKLYHELPNLIVLEFDKAWTWDEYFDWITRFNRACAAVEGTAHAVVNHANPFPPGNAIRNFISAEKESPDNLREVAVVFRPGDMMFIQTMLRIVQRVQPFTGGESRVRLYNDFDKALNDVRNVARLDAENMIIQPTNDNRKEAG